MKQLSIIIPCLNEERRLGPTLQALKQQSVAPEVFEVLVIDGGSSDGTIALAHEAGVRVIQCDRGLGRQRNTGARHASAEWIAFIDADCTASPNWVAEALRFIAGANADVVVGPVLAPESGAWIERAWGKHLEMRRRIAPKSCRIYRFLSTQNFIVRRGAFEKVGGIDEQLTSAEDNVLACRLWREGFHLAYDENLIVWHQGEPKSTRDFFLQQVWHSNRKVWRRIEAQGYGGRAFWYGIVHVACVAALLGGAVAGIFANSVLLPATMLFGYLLIPMMLAARAAWITGSVDQMFSLAALYLIYGLARASYILGLADLHVKGKRL